MLDRPHPTPAPPTLDPFALAKSMSGFHFIGGGYVPGRNGKSFAVVNPATGAEVAQAAEGDAADVDAAVQNAARAQKEWAKVPARKRGAMVHACAALLKEHVEELAKLIALETGKALRTESRVEAGVVADIFEFFGGLGSELKGESVPFAPNVLSVTVREPLGVVGAIIPWNVPMLLMALKVAPALVAGNSVVVKSAEEAPLAVLRICELMNRILPPGVFNMVSGFGPECGAPLVSHPLVRKVTFTGSVETGKIVAKAAAEKLIPVTLELGGKSPMIVFADCDFDKTVAGALTSMRFTRQGQSCTAASRIYVERPIFDRFVKAMKDAVDRMVMGDPLDEKTDIGTIVSQGQLEKVRGFIEEGTRTPGATALVCSAMPSDPALKKGLFIQPVIFTGLGADSRLVREEIFGPVTVMAPFDDPEAVLAEANDSEYGLAASLWTNNLKVGLDLAHRLEAGLVQINQNLVVQANLSYGGVKSSGLGKEASLEAMLEHFTHKKTIMVNMD
ncbi:aldehyde dehydrogenase [Siccirubricoccus deserti]|uniref:Aldehyde dehydrogenase family protein n=1 Tax=Siccirubricoccus deserti TaxID=2013562 RepID=A0A9X0UIY9_9PROT|nr:aldehyde dehydrogenase family protein [Siccirubricoccus deserti]MBC4017530.1 aldehyde dehydrogenase family protein [Siccirubricoccus deserti]GGC59665.1 aldehyde dehydrogenase [Siccirubricoccus deserti]